MKLLLLLFLSTQFVYSDTRVSCVIKQGDSLEKLEIKEYNGDVLINYSDLMGSLLCEADQAHASKENVFRFLCNDDYVAFEISEDFFFRYKEGKTAGGRFYTNPNTTDEKEHLFICISK